MTCGMKIFIGVTFSSLVDTNQWSESEILTNARLTKFDWYLGQLKSWGEAVDRIFRLFNNHGRLNNVGSVDVKL